MKNTRPLASSVPAIVVGYADSILFNTDALLLGWIAAGLLLGVKVMRALTHKDPNHVTAVAVGILILSFLSLIPCLGGIVSLSVAMWSLGAVLYSLFGTRAYNEPGPRILGNLSGNYDPRMDKM